MVPGKKLLLKLLYKLYAINLYRLRKDILSLVEKIDGGRIRSKMLRRIFHDYHDIEIGLYSYGSCFNLGLVPASTKIGRYCSFGPDVKIFNANHPMKSRSTHPYFFNPIFGYVPELMIKRKSPVIGNDVWIGGNAIILPSVSSIGDGSVIGAGAVVTKDVPDFAVVVGNPAKIIKYRFPEEIRKKVKASNWWSRDIEQLKVYLNDFIGPLN